MQPKDKLLQAYSLFDEVVLDIRRRQDLALRMAEEIAEGLDPEPFREFLKQPYILTKKHGTDWWCAVPKFVPNFSCGYLDHSTPSYNVFLITMYTRWLGDVPAEILAHTGLSAPPGKVLIQDNHLYFDSSSESIVRKHKKMIYTIKGSTAQIIRGQEFKMLAAMINEGYLPFIPHPVKAQHRRLPQVKFDVTGKYSYQERAADTFFNMGAVTVCWMTGAGKSFLAMYVLDSLVGRKLLVVPTRTLIDQWTGYFREYAPRLCNEVELITYNAYEKVKNNQYVCVIADECHRLPANTFSRLATLRTEYRMGLSASPYREDGRTDYIFALCGYPIGEDWKSMLNILGKDFHVVNLWVVKEEADKIAKVGRVLEPGTKTLIFCDSIDLGARVATRFNLPHIYGTTKDRLSIVKNHTQFVGSRVLDMGVSISDLEHVIEVDFLAGSRQQEIQRTGRLFHSDREGRHDIIMTRDEFERYGKRLHVFPEKGFRINPHFE